MQPNAYPRYPATGIVRPKNMPRTLGIATGAFIAERDDWDASVAKAAAGGFRDLELTAIRLNRLDALFAFLTRGRSTLDQFDRVSIHAPAGDARGSTEAVISSLTELDDAFDIVLHPDVYGDERSVRHLRDRAVFENMDCEKDFGRDAGDLEHVFETFPEAGFCLDVAHVWTNDPGMALAGDLLAKHGHRLRQVHLSGIEKDGTHRPTTEDDLRLYEPVLARCRNVPWLLETELAAT